MEAVNKRAAAQGKAIVDNRTLLIERFKTFQSEVMIELKKATQYLDLKAYDQSIEKVEKDLTAFFSDLGVLRRDFEEQNTMLRMWREKLANDMQVFYNEYDDKIKEGSVTEDERQLFKEAVKDLNAITDKNTENIQLIARELTDSQETIGSFDSRVNQLQTFLGEQMTATEKSFQDQSY